MAPKWSYVAKDWFVAKQKLIRSFVLRLGHSYPVEGIASSIDCFCPKSGRQDYIRPFGCHVTILNTLSSLGKFDGKSDEGFLVGYSVNSKAFRVYNLVTKRVEVNLHVNFLEEKPNVQGIGHRWMFDLDYLTDSMNYIPVSLQNQANPAGSKEVIDIDVQTEEAADLMVVSSTSLTEATRKAAVSEKIATKKTHSPKQPSSTPISKYSIQLKLVVKILILLSGSTTGNIEAISPSDDHEEEVFSDADDDEMPEIRIYDKSSEGIFEQASYDDDGIITDFNNLPDEVDVSTNHTLRIHNAHPQRKFSEALTDRSWVEGYAGRTVAVQSFTKQEEGIDYDEFLLPVARNEAIRRIGKAFDVLPKTSRSQCSQRIFKYLKGKPNLDYGILGTQPLQLNIHNSDYGGSNLDRKSTTGGCQFLGQRLISWQCKKQTIVATSTTEAEYVAAANCCGQVLWVQNQLLDYGFNFMNTKIHIDNESTICIVKNPVYHSKTKHIEIRHHFIRDCYEKKLISVEKIHTDLNVADLYALTANPTIYDSLVKQFWQSAIAHTRADGSLEIIATIDTIRYTISEASIRDSLQLDDATGITMLPNVDLFEGMGQIGYPTDGTFTFWKSFFTPQWRYLVHHLLHCISSKSGGWDQFGSNIATALICLSTGRVYNFSKLIFDGMVANLKSKKKFLMYPRFLQMILNIQTENKHPYLAVSLTKKIFGNMKRGFQGAPRPLLPSMLLVASNPNAGQDNAAQGQPIPSPTPPPIPTPTPPSITTPTPPPTSPPPPPPETEPTTDEYIYEEHSPVHHHFSPSQEQAPSRMPMDDLLHTVPKLISRIDSLELDLKQTKLTMGNAIVKLVKKVKKLEGFLKRRNLVLTDSEDEEPEAQGRKSQADPQDSSIQGLVTPPTTKAHASGEEQVEDISPNTLEAAKTLSKVASLKSRSIDKGRRYKRRKETKSKKVVSSLDFQEDDAGAEKINTAGEINAASIEVNTASKVNTGSIELNTVIEQDSTAGENKGQREGKAPMLSEETPKKSKEQILQEEASLAEAIRKKKAQVQFEAQYYTNEDWDLIRAKLEANAELSKSMLGSELQGEDFAKRMVDLVNQRKKLFAEERANLKSNKPLTQSQLKTYMMNYLKNQGSWKINQLKKLSFAEVKEEFDKLVKQIESFAPISFEATKASLKRFGEELQTRIVMSRYGVDGTEDKLEKEFWKCLRIMFEEPLSTDYNRIILGQHNLLREKISTFCWRKCKYKVENEAFGWEDE
ncbi:putative ribonuclease H-like domain-containing protein [Tanacetum coccineum]|uniref:Ribonuclease H-like domain-containing protein n=1 Tax=Tanacetum coccineum TaxID=301880 RepID=A0ABQ5FG89_9ASTR